MSAKFCFPQLPSARQRTCTERPQNGKISTYVGSAKAMSTCPTIFQSLAYLRAEFIQRERNALPSALTSYIRNPLPWLPSPAVALIMNQELNGLSLDDDRSREGIKGRKWRNGTPCNFVEQNCLQDCAESHNTASKFLLLYYTGWHFHYKCHPI